MASEWFVKRNDKKLGPFSNKDLRKLAAAGKLVAEDLVWKEGLMDWVTASRVESLFDTHSEALVEVPADREDSASFREAAPSDEEIESDSISEASEDEELPPLPPLPKRGRLIEASADESIASPRFSPTRYSTDSTDRLCWWLKFYARVNFACSLLVCTPMFLVGMILIVVCVANLTDPAAAQDDNDRLARGFLAGVTLSTSLVYVLVSLLWFMLMNVFTLACFWGAEVLQLLKRRR